MRTLPEYSTDCFQYHFVSFDQSFDHFILGAEIREPNFVVLPASRSDLTGLSVRPGTQGRLITLFDQHLPHSLRVTGAQISARAVACGEVATFQRIFQGGSPSHLIKVIYLNEP